MRHVIHKKDDFFVVGKKRVDVDVDAVKLPDFAAVAWNFNWADKSGPYGTVTDLRVEDGEITGEVRIYDPTWDADSLEEVGGRFGGYYKSIEYNEDGTRVLSCELVGVSIVLNAANPGASI